MTLDTTPDEASGTAARDGAPWRPRERTARRLTADVRPSTPPPLTMETKGILTKGIRRRRSTPIHGYVGLNGNFKTWSMVRDTLPSLALGRRVLSTVEILDPHTGNPHPLYVPFRSWAQLHEFRDGDILLDEVTGIMDARDQGMPKHVRRLLPQMRRRNVMIRWTGIDWDNSDRRLRQVTQAVTKCRGYMPNYALTRAGDADVLSMWAPNRLAKLTTFDAGTLAAADDTAMLTAETEKKRRARILNREFTWAPSSVTFQCYNTLAAVSQVDASCGYVDPVTGVRCGGKVPEKACKTPLEHGAWVVEFGSRVTPLDVGAHVSPQTPDHSHDGQ